MLETLADEYVHTDGADPAVLFTLVYRKFSGAVLGYLRARGVDDPEAVTQDVFLAFYPKLDGLQGGVQGAKSLIFSIAHARMVDHYRRNERTPSLSPYESEFDARRTPSAEDLALAKVDGGAGALLDGLSPDYQEVLALRVVADLSIEQAAEIMGRTPGAVKQLYRRALCALRERASIGSKAHHE
ncbi:sigma-70 family RNA polymerase sigma factor [Arthrobacter sp. 24S4-2]|uniref:RNA polymerase sigma factor n=1 Tax=Arthrobacter sp. 24S4-2 TaxID=2575374 RepID=UPI0010C7CFE5|nr:sigma-70 family RNA polymerase sigma factor [Arthrobacter sp. 24S4-2]QCP00200.1 sigma-70 family RNA polymerase sigma factor [Arthrobacter sp. 24S4-2]